MRPGCAVSRNIAALGDYAAMAVQAAQDKSSTHSPPPEREGDFPLSPVSLMYSLPIFPSLSLPSLYLYLSLFICTYLSTYSHFWRPLPVCPPPASCVNTGQSPGSHSAAVCELHCWHWTDRLSVDCPSWPVSAGTSSWVNPSWRDRLTNVHVTNVNTAQPTAKCHRMAVLLGCSL